MILLVTYDLHNPGRDYESVADFIAREADSFVHPQQSVWFVDTQHGCAAWRDGLKKSGDANDEYFVLRMQMNWAASNVDRSATSWLKDPSRSW